VSGGLRPAGQASRPYRAGECVPNGKQIGETRGCVHYAMTLRNVNDSLTVIAPSVLSMRGTDSRQIREGGGPS